MKRFRQVEKSRSERFELHIRPEATGGKWVLHAVGTYQEVLIAMATAPSGKEFNIREVPCPNPAAGGGSTAQSAAQE